MCFTSARQYVLHTVIYIALEHVVPYLATKTSSQSCLLCLSLGRRQLGPGGQGHQKVGVPRDSREWLRPQEVCPRLHPVGGPVGEEEGDRAGFHRGYPSSRCDSRVADLWVPWNSLAWLLYCLGVLASP